MFTGIVEEIGTLVDRKGVGTSLRLQIKAEKVLADMKIDDSISIDGCCQTVVKVGPSVFEVISVRETLQKTTLGSLTIGAKVNLERAATPASRLGGHIVLGHVDACARLDRIEPLDGSWEFYFELPGRLLRYATEVGSIALNGVSLTIAGIEGARVKIAVIPHTFEVTNFGLMTTGSSVNVEMDAIAKMVEKFVHTAQGT